MPSRKAVIFSGKSSPASCCNRAIHSWSVSRVAWYSRSTSSVASLPVRAKRRQPGPMQDLVGVGVTDPTEEPRVGERPLESMVLSGEALREGRKVGVEYFESATLKGNQPLLPDHEVDRGPSLGAGLGKEEQSIGELEDSQHQFPADLLDERVPAQTAGDHQMNDDEEVSFEREHDPLAQAAKPDYSLAFRSRNRRIKRAHDERVPNHDPLDRLVEDHRREALKVEDDIGEFGHARRAMGWGCEP